MFRIIALAVAALALAVSAVAPDSRDTFQEIYAHLDLAVATKDQVTIDRLIAADAQIHFGPVNLSLRGSIATEVASKSLISRRSEVKSARIEGKTAVVIAEILYVSASGGKSHETRATVRDTWERGDAGWLCRESERTGAESSVRPTSVEEARPVVAELKQRAVKLTTVEPGAAFEDLEAFGKAVGDARIVALGEATHGTREFFLLKQRLIEYLVRRKGFSVVAFEYNWPDTDEIDRYIKMPDAPRPRWGLAEMMNWMRAENQGGARLTWSGFDMQAVGHAADLAIGYLRHVSPDLAVAAAEAYVGARRIDDDHTNIFLVGAGEAVRRAESVLAQFDAHRLEWIAKSSPAEWRDARHAAATVVEAAKMRIEGNGPKYRDRIMAQNVAWLADEEYPSQKIILWAQNGHVAADGDQTGGWLRKRFEQAYYAVGTAFRRGEIWAYGVEGNQNKGLGAWPVAPAPEGSGGAILSEAEMPLFFLDMRSVPRDGPLGAWLEDEHRFNLAGGVVMIGKENMDSGTVRRMYDGLVFVEESHAAH